MKGERNEKKNLPIKLEIIALVLFSTLGIFIIETWKGDTNPNVDKYLFYLSIDFSLLLSTIILIIRKLMKIFKHKDERDYYISANYFYKERLYKKSIEYYDKAIELNSKFAEAYENRGLAYFEIGEYNKATKDFKKAKELSEELNLKK